MKKRYFIVNGKQYGIPEDKVNDFLSKNPSAQEGKFYSVKGKDYVIPTDRAAEFEKYHGLTAQEPAPAPAEKKNQKPDGSGSESRTQEPSLPSPGTEPKAIVPAPTGDAATTATPPAIKSVLPENNRWTGGFFETASTREPRPEIQAQTIFSPTETPKEKIGKLVDQFNVAAFVSRSAGVPLVQLDKEEILSNPEKLSEINKVANTYYENRKREALADRNRAILRDRASFFGDESAQQRKNIEEADKKMEVANAERQEAMKAVKTQVDELLFDYEPVKNPDGTTKWAPRKQPPMKDGRPDYTHGVATLGKEQMRLLDPIKYSQYTTPGADMKMLDVETKMRGSAIRIKGIGKRIGDAVSNDPDLSAAAQAYYVGNATPEQLTLLSGAGVNTMLDEYKELVKYQQNLKYEHPEIRKAELLKAVNDAATARFGAGGTKENENVLKEKGLGWASWMLSLVDNTGFTNKQIDSVIKDFKANKQLANPIDQKILDEILKGKIDGTLDFNQSWANEMLDNAVVSLEDFWKSIKRDLPMTFINAAGKMGKMRYGYNPVEVEGSFWNEVVENQKAEILTEKDADTYEMNRRWSPTETQFYVQEYVDSDPNSPTFMQVVKNNGKKGGFSLGNIAYNSAKQFGQLGTQMVTSAVINAATGGTAGFATSVMLPTFAMVYDQNLKESYDIVGADEKDAWKNFLYAGITSSFEGLSEKFGNPLEQSKVFTKLLEGGLKKNIAGAVSQLTVDNMRTMGKDGLQKIVTNAVKQTAKATGKAAIDMGGQSIEEFSNVIASSLVQDAFNPEYREGNMLEEAGKVFLETFASMGFTGASSFRGNMRGAFSNRLSADAVQMLAANPEKAKANIELEENTTREQKDDKIRLINTIVEAEASAKAVSEITRNTTGPLAKKEHKQLVMATANEIDLNRQIKAAKEKGDDALVSALEAENSKFSTLRKKILEGKIAFDPLTGAPWVAPVADMPETEDADTPDPTVSTAAPTVDIMDMLDVEDVPEAQPDAADGGTSQVQEEEAAPAPFELQKIEYQDGYKEVADKAAANESALVELQKDLESASAVLAKKKEAMRTALGDQKKTEKAQKEIDYAEGVVKRINRQISQLQGDATTENYLAGVVEKYKQQFGDTFSVDETLSVQDQIAAFEAEVDKRQAEYDTSVADYNQRQSEKQQAQKQARKEDLTARKGGMLGNRNKQQGIGPNGAREQQKVTAEQRRDFNEQKKEIDTWLAGQNAIIRKAADQGASVEDIEKALDVLKKEYQKRINELAKDTLPSTRVNVRATRQGLNSRIGVAMADSVSKMSGTLQREAGGMYTLVDGDKVIELGKDVVEVANRLSPVEVAPAAEPAKTGAEKIKARKPRVTVTDENTAVVNGVEFRIVTDAKGNVRKLESLKPAGSNNQVAWAEVERVVAKESTLVAVEVQRNRLANRSEAEPEQVQQELEAQGVSIDEQSTIDRALGLMLTESVADILENGVTVETTDAQYLQVELFVESATSYLKENFPNSDYAKAIIESLADLQKIVDNEYDRYAEIESQSEPEPDKPVEQTERDGAQKNENEQQQEAVETAFINSQGESLQGMQMSMADVPMEIIAVKTGMQYRIYELATGMEIFTVQGFSIDEIETEIRNKFYEKGRTPDKLTSLIYSNIESGKFKQKNYSPAYEQYLKNKQEQLDALPFVYSDEERDVIRGVVDTAEENDLSESDVRFFKSLIDAKATKNRLVLSIEKIKEVLADKIKKNRARKDKQEAIENGEPFPSDLLPEPKQLNEETFNEFISSSDRSTRRRDALKREGVYDVVFEAWTIVQLRFQKFGYLDEENQKIITKALNIIGGINARNESRKNSIPELVDELREMIGINISSQKTVDNGQDQEAIDAEAQGRQEEDVLIDEVVDEVSKMQETTAGTLSTYDQFISDYNAASDSPQTFVSAVNLIAEYVKNGVVYFEDMAMRLPKEMLTQKGLADFRGFYGAAKAQYPQLQSRVDAIAASEKILKQQYEQDEQAQEAEDANADAGASTETIVSASEAAISQADAAQTEDEIDAALEEIDRQLTATEKKITGLIANYSTEDINHELPNYEVAKRVKKELRKYGRVVAKLLGLEAPEVGANIAPAGGDGDMRFVISPDQSLYVSIKYDDDWQTNRGGMRGGYSPVQIMYRIESKSGKGSDIYGVNNFIYFEDRAKFGWGQSAGTPDQFSPQDLADALQKIMPKPQVTIREVAAASPNIMIVRPSAQQAEEAVKSVADAKTKEQQLMEDLKSAWKKLKGSGSTLSVGGLDPQKIENAVQVVAVAVKLGYLKFREMVKFLYENFGPEVAEFYEEIKAAYNQYGYKSATDEEALQMDEDIDQISYNQIINYGNERLLGELPAETAGSVLPENTGAAEIIRPAGDTSGEQSGEVRQGDSSVNVEGDGRTASEGTTSGDTDGFTIRLGQPVRGNGGLNQELGGATQRKPDTKPGEAVIHATHGNNFIIPDDFKEADRFSVAEKFDANLAALRTLIKVLSEKRQATPEEQKVLFRYVGWGGIKDIVRNPENDVEWQGLSSAMRERTRQLYSLVEEYQNLTGSEGVLENVKLSRQNAHYTAIPVIRGIYSMLEKIGFTGGRVLEPSMGIGHFFGAMPSEMTKKSALFGSEKEPITAAIAALLYPDALVRGRAYETAGFADNYFDLSISNVPFGQIQMFDKKFNTRELKPMLGNIHNYFIAKMIQQTRPGGLIAVITSRFTMDSVNADMRKYMNDNTEFLGAVRLPNTAFVANANTIVTTDVILLRKLHTNESVNNPDFISVNEIEVEKEDLTGSVTLKMNQYFIQNPQMVLGQVMGSARGMYGNGDGQELTVVDTGINIEAALAQLELRKSYTESLIEEEQSEKQTSSDTPGTLLVRDGKIFIVTGALDQQTGANIIEEPVKIPRYVTPVQVQQYYQLKNVLIKLYNAEYSGDDDAAGKLRKELNVIYDAFVSKYGFINNVKNNWLNVNDVDGAKLMALEVPMANGTYEKSNIFTQRVINSVAKRIDKTDSPSEALLVSLADHNEVRIDYISTLMGLSEDESIQALGDLVFEDPTGGFLTREAYLSGDVKTKLAEAIEAEKIDKRFSKNVEALRSVIPQDLTIEQIGINLGSKWIPAKIYEKFLFEVLGVESYIELVKVTDKFIVSGESGIFNPVNTDQFGTDRMRGHEIAESLMNMKAPTVWNTDSDGNRYVNTEETEKAREKGEILRAAFQEWVLSNSEVTVEVETIYNAIFNRTIKREFDGSHLTFPGYGWKYQLNSHQRNAVWMLLQNHGGIVDHIVGAGKTAVIAVAAMEMKRLGMAKKPLIVALKANAGAIAKDFSEIYPNAKILAPKSKDFDKVNRQKLLMMMANNDYDAIVITHDMFKRIPADAQTEREIVEEEIEELEKAMEQMLANGIKPSQRDYKTLENRIEKLRVKVKKLTSFQTDNVLDMGAIGIDHIMVDESHMFKNLMYQTAMNPQPAGLSPAAGSQRAYNMLVGVRFMQKKWGGEKGVTFLSGTPISNSMAEMYLLLKYLRPQWLKDRGLNTFDSWASAFARISNELEFTVTGTYKEKYRIRSWMNLPELALSYNEVADVRTDDNIKIDKPEFDGGNINLVAIDISAEQEKFMQKLADAGQLLKNKNFSAANNLIGDVINTPFDEKNAGSGMLVITGLAAKASLDMGLLGEKYRGKGDKITEAVKNAVSIYEETTPHRGVQLIFSNLGTPKSISKVQNLYDYLQEELGFDKEELDKLFGDVNNEKHRFPTLSQIKEKVQNEDAVAGVFILNGDNYDDVVNDSENWAKGSYNVYQVFKDKLVKAGIPENEIAFIHDYDNQVKRDQLFKDVREGKIRFVIGSTQKLGTGVNVQTRIVAMHHLDIPWTPADLEQRNGRGIRQGNEVAKKFYGNRVRVYAYGTKQTLDAYKFQLLSNKQKFMNDIKRGAILDREVAELQDDDNVLAAMVAELSGNKDVYELEKIKNKRNKLHRSYMNHLSALKRAEQSLRSTEAYDQRLVENIPNYSEDLAEVESTYQSNDASTAILELLTDEENARHEEKVKGLQDERLAEKEKGVSDVKAEEKYQQRLEKENERYEKALETIKEKANDPERIDKVKRMMSILVDGNQVIGFKKTVNAIKSKLKNSFTNRDSFGKRVQIATVSGMPVFATLKEVAGFDAADSTPYSFSIVGKSGYVYELRAGTVISINSLMNELDSFNNGTMLRRMVELSKSEIINNKKKIEVQQKIINTPFANKEELEQLEIELKEKEVVVKEFLKAKEAELEEKARLLSEEMENDTLGDIDTRFNRAEGTQPDISPEELSAFNEEHGEAIKGMSTALGVDVQVVANVSDLPTGVRALIQRTGGITPAVFTNGKVYIVASGIKASGEDAATQIKKSILHEVVGHKGVIETLGKDMNAFDSFMEAVYASMSEQERARLSRLYPGASNVLIAEEYVARVAERDMPAPSNWQMIVTTIKQYIQEFLDVFGIKMAVTDNDINVILAKGRTALRKARYQQAQQSVFRKNIIGQIGGRKLGGTIAQALDRAIQMKEQGRSDEDIRMATGWEFQNGKWKMWYAPDIEVIRRPKKGEQLLLSDIVSWPSMFAAYPQLKDIVVNAVPGDVRYQGRADVLNGVIDISGSMLEPEYGPHHLLIHEIQHFIQEYEGFENGTSPYGYFKQVHYQRAAQLMNPNSSVQLQRGIGEALFTLDRTIAQLESSLYDYKYPMLSDAYKAIEDERQREIDAGGDVIAAWDNFREKRVAIEAKAKIAYGEVKKALKEAKASEEYAMLISAKEIIYFNSMGEVEARKAAIRYFSRDRIAGQYVKAGMDYADALSQANADMANISINKAEDVANEDIVYLDGLLNEVDTTARLSIVEQRSEENAAKYSRMAKEGLAVIFPQVPYIEHVNEDDGEYAKGESESVRLFTFGYFNPKDSSIHINMRKLADAPRVGIHEAVHPIVNWFILSDSNAQTSLYQSIMALQGKGILGVDNAISHAFGTGYAPNEIANELVTEFLTQVVLGNVDLSSIEKSLMDKIIDALNRLFEKIGIETRISNVNDLRRVSESVHALFHKGEKRPIVEVIGTQPRLISDGVVRKARGVDATGERERQYQNLAFAYSNYVAASHVGKSPNQIAKEYAEVVKALTAIAEQDGRIKKAETLLQIAADAIGENTGIANADADAMLAKAATTALKAARIDPANKEIADRILARLPDVSIEELSNRVDASQRLTEEQKEQIIAYYETLLPPSKLYGTESSMRPGQFMPADTERAFRAKVGHLAMMADETVLANIYTFTNYVSSFLGVNYAGTQKEAVIKDVYNKNLKFRTKLRELEIDQSRTLATMPMNLIRTELLQYASWDEIARRAMYEKKALGMPYDDTFDMVEEMITMEGPAAVQESINAMLQFMTAEDLQDFALFAMPLVKYYLDKGMNNEAEVLTKQLTRFTVGAGRFIGSLNTIYQRLGRFGKAGRRLFIQKLLEQVNSEAVIANAASNEKIKQYTATLQSIQREAGRMSLDKTKAENQKTAERIKAIIDKICKTK